MEVIEAHHAITTLQAAASRNVARTPLVKLLEIRQNAAVSKGRESATGSYDQLQAHTECKTRIGTNGASHSICNLNGFT